MTDQDWHDQFQARLDAMQQRMENYFDNQFRLNADLRTRQELQAQQIDGLIQVAKATLNSIQGLRDEFRQHRSDGHGA